jgi:hypothetical protein
MPATTPPTTFWVAKIRGISVGEALDVGYRGDEAVACASSAPSVELHIEQGPLSGREQTIGVVIAARASSGMTEKSPALRTRTFRCRCAATRWPCRKSCCVGRSAAAEQGTVGER